MMMACSKGDTASATSPMQRAATSRAWQTQQQQRRPSMMTS
ncbi:hypothetical protein OK016_19380 [Vibrio chagasii]|nr:hypothetical protein [Vibrio chagasii]